MANTLRFKRGLASGIPTALAGEPLFTTDTFDLYIGNGTTNTRFQKYIASGATTQILRGDGSLYTFPLAISSPSNGQVLKYNGTSWVNDSDSGITGSGAAGQVAYFTGATTQAGSNNLFWDNTNGRLGVGTNNPAYTFHAISSASTIGAFRNSAAALGQLLVGNTAGDLQLRILASGDALIFSDSGKYMALGSNGAERARIFTNGNFGINTGATDSGEKLQVTGTMKVTGAVALGSTISALQYTAQSDTAYYRVRRAAGTDVGYITDSTTWGTTGTDFSIGASSANLRFFTNNSVTERMRLDASGNLGLGVVPSAWQSVYRAIEIGFTSLVVAPSNTEYFALGSNWFYNSAGTLVYKNSVGTANMFETPVGGGFRWRIAPSGTAGNAITFTQAMTLFATNNLAIGSTSDSGERLQVTGTAKITGATSVTNTMTARQVIVDGANNSNISRINLTRTDASWGVYNETDFRIYYSSGNTTTPSTQYFSLGSGTGLATFSNALTIGGNLTVDTNTLFVDATNNRVGIGNTNPDKQLTISSTFPEISLRRSDSVSPAAAINFVGSDNAAKWQLATNNAVGGAHFEFNYAGSNFMLLRTDGNLLLGSTTSSGERLQVNGTAKIGTYSTTGYSLVVQNNGANDVSGIRISTGATVDGYLSLAYDATNTYGSIQAGDNNVFRNIVINRQGGSVGIGANPNNSAVLQADSTTRGFLPPRMTTTQKNAIPTPAAGLVVYDTTTNKLCCYDGTNWNDLF